MSGTLKFGGLVHVLAACRECEWSCSSRNGMGLAAQHHYKTRHIVNVESGYSLTFVPEEKEAIYKGEGK